MTGPHTRRWFLLVLALLALASLACNLSATSNEGDAEVEAITSSPLVLLLAPVNGSTFAEGAEVQLHAIAQDTGLGVARIEFRVDDAPVGDVASSQPDGQETLDANIVWVAAGAAGHLVTVEAFRSDGSSLGLSDAAVKVMTAPGALPAGSETEIQAAPGETVPAEQPPEQPPADALPAEGEPVEPAAPPDTTGSPMIEAATPSLNVRQGPGTDYPAVGTLSQGERADIVGRNEDGSWWAISFGSGTAWVFGGLTTTVGDVSQVPLVAAPAQ
ncbi:MAG: SH3 domain-containing protein [Anaerolineae bacterium]|nr:SH3 domain-containing protein [Anaerolineae bacterium]